MPIVLSKTKIKVKYKKLPTRKLKELRHFQDDEKALFLN